MKPFYPPESSILASFKKRRVNALLQHEPELLFFACDGAEPEMKRVGRKKRNKDAVLAEERLDELKKRAASVNGCLSEQDLAEIKKTMKQISKPSDEKRQTFISWLQSLNHPGVKIVMAPFEAEWQLVAEQSRFNNIDIIVAEDSDAIALGATDMYLCSSLEQTVRGRSIIMRTMIGYLFIRRKYVSMTHLPGPRATKMQQQTVPVRTTNANNSTTRLVECAQART